MTSANEARDAEILAVRPFFCPIKPASSPWAAELNTLAEGWLSVQGFEPDRKQRERLSRANLGELAARTMPDGHKNALANATRQYVAFFALDDACFDEPPMPLGRLTRKQSIILSAIQHPETHWPGEDAYVTASRDIANGWKEIASPVQFQRWVEGMRAFFFGVTWEAVHRHGRELPRLNEYVAMWMRAIGMSPVLALIDTVGGYEVPSSELAHPQTQALVEMAHFLVAWDNDFISRAKEIQRAHDRLNIVDVIAAERGIEPAQALDAATAMRDRVMCLFLHTHDWLTSRPATHQNLRKYADGLANYIRGHLDWALSCDRYANVRPPENDAPANEKAPPASWKDAPDDDDFMSPLPIPAIAWWWTRNSQ
ncbi:terpene synthase family protein [Actinomadura litoris]|uniref:Terpene synthase n=1 Tax=Actinomadura litoris TaxID=2678616 RepID=A0A7K1L1G9_9ACTN|nr:hypothetical protein [Actinomadura litoris]MUN38086.1 hypothetical protein [Actinomadura litoris]